MADRYEREDAAERRAQFEEEEIPIMVAALVAWPMCISAVHVGLSSPAVDSIPIYYLALALAGGWAWSVNRPFPPVLIATSVLGGMAACMFV